MSAGETPITESEAAPPAVEPSHELEEKRIGDLVTALIPVGEGGEITPLGQSVFALMISEVGRERARCIQAVRDVIDSAHRAANQARGVAQAAQLAGDQRTLAQAQHAAAQGQILGMALMAVANMLAIPPGVCRSCAGTKLMSSPLARDQITTCTACAQAPQKDETAS